MTIKELIAALQKAEGPSRILDEVLFEMAHGRKRRISTFEQYEPSEKLTAYTASIDAALTLVPAEREVCLYTYTEPRAGGRVCLYIRDDFRCGDEGRHPSSLAIAICIAALKARGVGDG